MAIFRYGKTEFDYLKSRCPVLGGAMDRIGMIERAVEPDLFTALVHSIVSQQISGRACLTIWNRFRDRFASVTPETMFATNTESLRQCGISVRKASYIKEAAETIRRGGLGIERLPALSDEAVRQELVRLKGVGEWTAEMLMIFSMQRPDVLSRGDLAIQRGLRMLYRHRTITEKLFEKYRRRFAPYASIASLYLWEIAGGGDGEWTDPGAAKRKSSSRRTSE